MQEMRNTETFLEVQKVHNQIYLKSNFILMLGNNGGPHEIKLERRLNSPYDGREIFKITQIL